MTYELDTLTGEIVPTTPIAPTPEQASEAMQLYQEISRALLTPDDMTKIGRKEFPNRSAFQKLGNAYRVSTTIVKDDDDYDPDGHLIRSKITVRATHPDGRTAEGDGRCHIAEKGKAAEDPKSEHDVHGTAVTRATNRAISNLVAFGAVSAEEVDPTVEAEPEREHGPAATGRQQAKAAEAVRILYGEAGDSGEVIAKLIKDSGGYLPKVVARALMLVAAHRPGRRMTGTGTEETKPPEDDTTGRTETPDEAGHSDAT